MPLTGKQFEQIHTALLNAFDRASLRQMALFELDVELNHVAGGQNDSEVVHNLLVWAIRAERLPDLIRAALRQNPDNAILQQLATDALTWDLSDIETGQFQAIGSTLSTTIHVGDKVEGDNVAVTVGDDAQFVAAGKNVQ